MGAAMSKDDAGNKPPKKTILGMKVPIAPPHKPAADSESKPLRARLPKPSRPVGASEDSFLLLSSKEKIGEEFEEKTKIVSQHKNIDKARHEPQKSANNIFDDDRKTVIQPMAEQFDTEPHSPFGFGMDAMQTRVASQAYVEDPVGVATGQVTLPKDPMVTQPILASDTAPIASTVSTVSTAPTKARPQATAPEEQVRALRRWLPSLPLSSVRITVVFILIGAAILPVGYGQDGWIMSWQGQSLWPHFLCPLLTSLSIAAAYWLPSKWLRVVPSWIRLWVPLLCAYFGLVVSMSHVGIFGQRYGVVGNVSLSPLGPVVLYSWVFPLWIGFSSMAKTQPTNKLYGIACGVTSWFFVPLIVHLIGGSYSGTGWAWLVHAWLWVLVLVPLFFASQWFFVPQGSLRGMVREVGERTVVPLLARLPPWLVLHRSSVGAVWCGYHWLLGGIVVFVSDSFASAATSAGHALLLLVAYGLILGGRFPFACQRLEQFARGFLLENRTKTEP